MAGDEIQGYYLNKPMAQEMFEKQYIIMKKAYS